MSLMAIVFFRDQLQRSGMRTRSPHEKHTPSVKAGCSPPTASSCFTDIKISRTNPPVKGFPLRTVGGGRTGLGELHEEGTMQEVIVMHGEEGKRTIFFRLRTLYSFSGVLVSFDFLFGFLLCKRRTCRQAMRLHKRIVTASGKCLCECLYWPIRNNISAVVCQAGHPSVPETAHDR